MKIKIKGWKKKTHEEKIIALENEIGILQGKLDALNNQIRVRFNFQYMGSGETHVDACVSPAEMLADCGIKVSPMKMVINIVDDDFRELKMEELFTPIGQLTDCKSVCLLGAIICANV